MKSWGKEILQGISKHITLLGYSTVNAASNKNYGCQHGNKVQQLVFDDASEIGLCVVAFLRIGVEDEVRVSFVMGKKWVAPIKITFFPKLELRAALHASSIKVSTIQ